MAFTLPGMAKGGSWREIAAAVAVLTLATTGNAILPIPYAFAVSGAVAATLIIVFVALSNVFTSGLLLRGAVSVGASDYEQLAAAVGGPWLRLWSEIWIVILLFGTNMGAIIQMGEAFGFAVQTQWPDAPNWLWDRSGTAAMIFFTLAVIFPLSMMPKMRSLEMVGNGGVVILFALAVIVMVKAISNGMPALASGDFPSVSSNNLTSISETFSLMCFAFYHQVMMMPMFAEMPRISSDCAKRNAHALHKASTIVILGTSGMYYWVTGFFGASMYGVSETSDNILQNIWLPGVGTFIMNFVITIYLSISIPPIFHACNHTVDNWLRQLFPRDYAGLTRPWVQRFVCNLCTILPCLGVALGVPGESGTVLSVTGATGVAMCSYVLPVLFHFALYFRKARIMRLPPSARQPAASIASLDGAEAATHSTPTTITTATAAGTNLSPLDSSIKSGNEGGNGSPKSFVQEPQPDAPPGLLYAYRVPNKHPAMVVAFELVLPVLVTALGCFFSVTTLVLLFQPVEE